MKIKSITCNISYFTTIYKKKRLLFQIEQVSPGFSERYLLDPRRFQSELTEYRRYIKSMVELAGAGNMSANYANEILEFSTKIAQVSAVLYLA